MIMVIFGASAWSDSLVSQNSTLSNRGQVYLLRVCLFSPLLASFRSKPLLWATPSWHYRKTKRCWLIVISMNYNCNMAVLLPFIQLLNDTSGQLFTLPSAWMKAVQDDRPLMHLCGNQVCLFLQFLLFMLPNKASLLRFVDNRLHTWPQPQPEFITFREDSIQRPRRISGSLPVCDVVLESWETLGRVLFIHSRLNISVSGRHGNGWWRRYIWTLSLMFHAQEFYSNANSNCKCIDI